MKPDWNVAPEWANWLAQDSDGQWWWYADKPVYSGYTGRWHSDGKQCEAYGIHAPAETLEKRPV